MHVAVMIPCDQAQNTFRGAWKIWHESQRLCMHDVTTALLNTQFDGPGILLLMVSTAKELAAKMFQ
jgi:hypothetical protein